MWAYQKKLEYPVKIANPNPAYARIVIAQLGGPDGEMGAATRYLSQRYAMPYKEAKAMLTDIGVSVSVWLLWESPALTFRFRGSKQGFCDDAADYRYFFAR